MDKKSLILLEKFVYKKLSEKERSRVILIVDKKALSWKQMVEELKKTGDFSKRVEKEFKELLVK